MLLRVIETISSGLGLRALVQGVATLIADAIATDACFVYVSDPGGRWLTLSGATPETASSVGEVRLALDEGVTGWVAAHGQPVVLKDNKHSDPRYRPTPALGDDAYTSMASVPMTAEPGSVVGVLNVHSRLRREFGERDLQMLTSIGNLVAGAIGNARLHQRLQERERERERFAERTVALQENERRRVAAEIHDGISERIVGLTFHLSAAADAIGSDHDFTTQQIGEARRLAQEALEEARRAIANLRPAVLDDLGLPAALDSLAASVEDMELQLSVDLGDEPLPEHVETALYRITQEALRNALRHSGADRVEIDVHRLASSLVLKVRDDGAGFDPPVTGGPESDSYGLQGMRERADLIGGRLEVRSRLGTGTTIKVTVPLGPAVPRED